MSELNIYDQLHFTCAKLLTGLHIIEMENNDLAKEILQNEPSDKWIKIANNFEVQSQVLNKAMNFMLRMRTELERLSKQNKEFDNFMSRNKINSLENQIKTLKELSNGLV